MTARSPVLTVLALSLCIGAGCATLPDVSHLTNHVPTEKPPKILSARGMLTKAQSRALMEKLHHSARPTDILQRHNEVLEMVGGRPLTAGNRVKLLIDGAATYAAMFKAIEGARDSINVETYKIDDDETGRRFARLLLKKQAQGVQVNLLYDSIGTLATPDSFFEPLRKAGIQVVEVNPVNPLKVRDRWLPMEADHRKLLIVDGRLAITGGINISRVYTSTPFQSEKEPHPPVPWRDTDVELEGPVVADFQRFFVETWVKQKGPPLPERRYFPKLEKAGDALVRAIASSPGEKNRINYVSYLAAIAFARHSIYLTNAYFIPDDRIIKALVDAAKRGVDVKIILPSVSDSTLVLLAMRHNYAHLLKAGVKLYERHKALLHSKTAVIDGVWSTVGSTNLDYLSLSNNYEVNAVILSRSFGVEMAQMFAADLEHSEAITLQKWKERPVSQKVKEFFVHLFSHLM